MFRRTLATFVVTLLAAGLVPAAAGTVCPDSSYAVAEFGATYSGSYKPGQPYDYVTLWPRSTSDTFDKMGIVVRAFVKDCQGNPIPGVVAELRNDSLCIRSNLSDDPTDANGEAVFTQGIGGKGWATTLSVWADGVQIGVVPVKTNGLAPAEDSDDCCARAADFVFIGPMGAESGVHPSYSINTDYDENGFNDLVDWVIWNHRIRLGQPGCPLLEVQP